MHDSRPGSWPRRRFGLVAGGLVACLGGVAWPEAAGARKKRKHRCRRAGHICRQSGKHKRCCPGTVCERFDGANFRCCSALNEPCSAGGECCSGYCIEDRCGVT